MRDELELSYGEARDAATHLKQLLEHQGWQLFMEVLDTRVEAINNQLRHAHIRTPEDMIAFNRLQAGAEELTAIPRIMEAMVFDLDTQIKKMQEDELVEEEADVHAE